jgi:fatty-acid desaturase
METKTKILILVFVICSAISITVTYWRYVVLQDFDVAYDKSLFSNPTAIDIAEPTSQTP